MIPTAPTQASGVPSHSTPERAHSASHAMKTKASLPLSSGHSAAPHAPELRAGLRRLCPQPHGQDDRPTDCSPSLMSWPLPLQSVLTSSLLLGDGLCHLWPHGTQPLAPTNLSHYLPSPSRRWLTFLKCVPSKRPSLTPPPVKPFSPSTLSPAGYPSPSQRAQESIQSCHRAVPSMDGQCGHIVGAP